eukprot:Rmarinus@m.20669
MLSVRHILVFRRHLLLAMLGENTECLLFFQSSLRSIVGAPHAGVLLMHATSVLAGSGRFPKAYKNMKVSPLGVTVNVPTMATGGDENTSASMGVKNSDLLGIEPDNIGMSVATIAVQVFLRPTLIPTSPMTDLVRTAIIENGTAGVEEVLLGTERSGTAPARLLAALAVLILKLTKVKTFAIVRDGQGQQARYATAGTMGQKTTGSEKKR